MDPASVTTAGRILPEHLHYLDWLVLPPRAVEHERPEINKYGVLTASDVITRSERSPGHGKKIAYPKRRNAKRKLWMRLLLQPNADEHQGTEKSFVTQTSVDNEARRSPGRRKLWIRLVLQPKADEHQGTKTLF